MTTVMKSLQDLDVLVTKISDSTGLSREAVSSQMVAANIPAFQLDDIILVSPEDCGVIIDAWADKIKAELGLDTSVVTDTDTAFEIETETSTSPTSIETEPNSLSWPKGFEKLVNHQYGPSLKKILPADPAQSRAFLAAIAHGTEAGQTLSKQLVNAIVKKSTRNLSPEKVMIGLTAKCAALLES